jgi:predicted phage tail protein
MQQVVRLLGDLGERYGAEHAFYNLRTPADAIKLLSINYPEFKAELITAHEKGIGYRVLQAGVDLNFDELQLPIGQNDLIITPVLVGQGGAGKIFAGIGLIAVSFLLPGAGLFGTVGLFGAGAAGVAGISTTAVLTATAVGTALSVAGASMILGGVTEMLSPQPDIGVGGVGTRDDLRATRPESVNRGADGQRSYAYLGAQNTVGVGATIPVAYGKVLIGSHVISADVDVADESDPLKTTTRTPGADTVTVQGNKLEFGARRDNMARWNSVHFRRNRSNTGADRFIDPKKDNELTAANDFHLEFGDGPLFDPNQYFVFLEVNELFELVGETKTDGFISYQIESRRKDTDNIHARTGGTIQGLITEPYRWYHKFDPSKAPNIDHYNLDIKILDASVASSVNFIIRHGFVPSIS